LKSFNYTPYLFSQKVEKTALYRDNFFIVCGLRVGNFRQKKINYAEDGIVGTIGLFQRNSGCSAEQKTIGIPFRTIPQRRKMLGILFCGTNL
jgi:hypothetical protein